MIIIEGHDAISHDGGVAILFDNQIIALAAERVDRTKHSCNARAAHDFMQDRLQWSSGDVRDFFQSPDDLAINHPLAHAASAFYPSPFGEALVLVIDGQGPYSDHEVVSLSVWHGKDLVLRQLEAYPEEGKFCSQSLGHLYSAITYYLGFGFYDQGKTMGLAAHGKRSPIYDEVARLCNFDGQRLRTDAEFIRAVFCETYGDDFGWPKELAHSVQIAKLEAQFGRIRRERQPLTERDLDLAYAGQSVLEERLCDLCKHLRHKYGVPHLCIAGGVGLNISANSRIAAESGFTSVFVQPAAGDDGQALGRLLFRMHTQFGLPRIPMHNAYLGPTYTEKEQLSAAESLQGIARVSELASIHELNVALASLIAEGIAVGRFCGRSEIGPRALGNRSILADPRHKQVAAALTELKHREPFQPFALSICAEHAHEYFGIRGDSPFMLLSFPALTRGLEQLEAGIHIDGSSRLQTVSADQNPEYHDLLRAFMEQAGVPALLNTSFNDRGDPIVETPADAAKAFRNMPGLGALAIGRYLIQRNRELL